MLFKVLLVGVAKLLNIKSHANTVLQVAAETEGCCERGCVVRGAGATTPPAGELRVPASLSARLTWFTQAYSL